MFEPADLSGVGGQTNPTGCDSNQGLFQDVKGFVLQPGVEARYALKTEHKHLRINNLNMAFNEISGLMGIKRRNSLRFWNKIRVIYGELQTRKSLNT